MKLLMTGDAVGGVWTYALDLARALAPLGVEVVLATMGPRPSAEQRREANALPKLQLLESDFALEWMPEPWLDVQRAGEWLLELEERFQPDVVQLGGFAHGAVSFRAPTVVVAHSCVLSWWRAVKGEAAPPEWNRYREEVARGLAAADVVVAPTQAMLDSLSEYSIALPRTRVIFNGADASRFAPAAKNRSCFPPGVCGTKRKTWRLWMRWRKI
jgi:glycosyltransferase involved in cell wall biosynthesis